MEFLKVEHEGKEYTGTFKIENCGKNKCCFIVEFKDYFHKDSSLFDCNKESQMKLHANFVLKDLIKKYLYEN